MIPDLEDRFLQPANWLWETFERIKGRNLRYGYALPEKPQAILVFLPGLNDFGEKYFEFARWALDQNYGFFVLDWFGQGKSGRYLENPHKRHAVSFTEDIADCEHWILKEVMPKISVPMILTGHSMGGNLGLHALYQEHELFAGACFIAPMFGIKTLRMVPALLVRSLNKALSERYVPGGTDWSELQHLPAKISFLTRDPARNLIDNAWAKIDEDIKIGAVTYGWVHEANESCLRLKDLDLESLQTPVLLFMAEHEILVDNRAIKTVAKRLPDAKLVKLEGSYHEPLMERDNIREHTLDYLQKFIKDNLPHKS